MRARGGGAGELGGDYGNLVGAGHAHDLDLKPSLTEYKRWSKGSRPLLRFSKTGDHNIEDAYARHFVSPRKGSFGAGVKDVLVDSAGTHMMGDQHATRD